MGFPVLHAGDRNLAVRAAQNALHRALAAKGLPHRNNRKAAYGSNTARDVETFKEAHKLPSRDGRIIGDDCWQELRPFLGLTDRLYVQRHNAKIAAKRAKELARRKALKRERQARAKRKGVARAAHAAWVHGGYIYRQWRAMAKSLTDPFAYTHTDCSSLATLSAKGGGVPDPNGFGYNGYGFTGTMDSRSQRGEWVEDPGPGDFAFYGPSRWNTTHMTVHDLDPRYVISLGSTPISRPPGGVRYRGDYVGSKRFPVD